MAKRKPKHSYKSKFERSIGDNLFNRGIPFEYEPFKLEYFKQVRNARCCKCGDSNCEEKRSYTPDFVLKNKKGEQIIIESKGKFTPENRTKMQAVKKSNPELDIRFIFMYDNWLTRKHKKRYSDWCDQNGFPYYIGNHVPKEWL